MVLNSTDVINFVKNWRENNGLSSEIKLNNKQIEKFVKELQKQISKMDFSVPAKTTVIAYSGSSNGSHAFEIAKKVSENAKDGAIYITDLQAEK